ncbi:phenylacetic acid degradation protein [Sphingomonas sp. Leaf339]|uniref:PaaI family thioesterase n=1 Tax=Sphingomonas sp. Leaf339 TaxID=1736343 RepID=UPI0006F8BCE7|nr:PaaI family thioesterase [Sphingomonas sp. Leaf339]KQU61688.1 phenylacetic acid degradation protein [Sphingomonas sp. Leaf339]
MSALPPYADLLGLTLERDESGAPVLAMPFDDGVLGRPGFLHGGAIAGLLEVAAIAALRHALVAEGDATIKPINVTIDYMRGGRDKMTRAAGVVTRLGTRIANVEATAWQDDRDRPIAAARMNYLLTRA